MILWPFQQHFSHVEMIVGKDDNERKCAMEPCLRLERIPLESGPLA